MVWINEVREGKMLQTAIEAAQRAGRMIAERYPGGRSITVKGFRDLVTDADIAAEEVILELIQTRFSHHRLRGGQRQGNQQRLYMGCGSAGRDDQLHTPSPCLRRFYRGAERRRAAHRGHLRPAAR